MTIDTMIDERHLLNHPFYRRWQMGKVQPEVLKEYAKQYYAYESALPSFLEKALVHLEDGPAKEALEENLADESGQPEPHPELWLRFAEAIGVSREEVQEAEMLPRTSNLVSTYNSLCEHGADEALGALYAYESQFSAIAKTKGDGLREFYGVAEPEALKFFDLHSTLDEEHAASIRMGMTDSALTRESVHLALEAWWGMLDQFEAMSENLVATS